MSARKKNKKISSDELRRKLKLKHFEAGRRLSEKFPHAKRILHEKGLDPSKLREHSAKLVGASALAGSLFLSPPEMKMLPAPDEFLKNLTSSQDMESDQNFESNENLLLVKKMDNREVLVKTLSSVLPEKPRPLDRTEEKLLEQFFGQTLGVKAKAALEGEHLNTTYGYIGAEQHLRRYPGDTLSQHGSGNDIKEGMAPGLGAWGYFTPSKANLTPEHIETEKWYAVVQTLYLPDWNTRQPYLKEWYKYRKILIVNTDNGNAVVAAIADSGPAAFTGKHFGGSPEVMNHLGGTRYKKGPVVVFFVDDPENKVPLGPVNYN